MVTSQHHPIQQKSFSPTPTMVTNTSIECKSVAFTKRLGYTDQYVPGQNYSWSNIPEPETGLYG